MQTKQYSDQLTEGVFLAAVSCSKSEVAPTLFWRKFGLLLHDDYHNPYIARDC